MRCSDMHRKLMLANLPALTKVGVIGQFTDIFLLETA